MFLSRIIHRPVLAIVISVVLLFLGTLAIKTLPISQFPSIAPTAVNIFIAYPGSSAEVLVNSTLIPLEQAINGVQGMRYISSDATSAGEATIRVIFEPRNRSKPGCSKGKDAGGSGTTIIATSRSA